MAISNDGDAVRNRTEAGRQRANAAPRRKAAYKTLSQLPVEPVYAPTDLVETDYLADIGLPGEYPYLRGVHPAGYRSRLWTMRMFAGFGQPSETNERFRFLLDQGETGLSVAFDMPTLYGYDQTTSGPGANSASVVWPCHAWRICRPSSTASRWTRSLRR